MLSSSGFCIEDAVGDGAANLSLGPFGMAILETLGEQAAHGGVHAQGCSMRFWGVIAR